MAEESFKRKLTAILSADVEGYSRLMGEDEDATIRTLTSYRELMTTFIKKHRGRVVDAPGDNLLAEFGSVVDAVRCAVEIQEELRVRNAELPDNRKMHFRIGINLGDVVEEGERIYGDGVNIAARVEGLAQGGGICISGTVYDSIKNKLSLSYESLGEHTVKNISEPVRVYRMRVGPEAEKAEPKRRHWAVMSGIALLIIIIAAVAIWNFYLRRPSIEPASVERMAFPLPDKPSIAVLPFDNLSKNPDQEYLADGITDQIITGLSMMPYIFVIARNSSFVYKGKPVKVQQVAQELGVQYVLEGSVQQSDNRIRVTAQLIDALTGRHVWSQRYDQLLEDIFSLQDEIMMNIMRAMDVSIVGLGTLQVEPIPQSAKAYFKFLEALELVYHWNRDDNLSARKLYQEAIDLYPEYGPAIGALGWTYYHEVNNGWTNDPAESLRQAEELGKKAITLGGTLGHDLLMSVYSKQGQMDKAIAEGEKALTISPNSAELNVLFGLALSAAGRPEEGIERVKKAIRLNPNHQPHYFWILGHCYLKAGMIEKGIEYYERFVKQVPNHLMAWLTLAGFYAELGLDEKAKNAAKEVHRTTPDYSWEKYGGSFKFDNKEYERRFLDNLRKVGLM